MEHQYLSTGCLHGRHDYCQSPSREDGYEKRPAQCKWCTAACECPCHVAAAGFGSSMTFGADPT